MNLSPTEERFYDLLLDGLPHRMDEFFSRLWDEQNEGKRAAVRMQIVRLRRKLEPHGLRIETRGNNGTTTYRLMRSVGPGE